MESSLEVLSRAATMIQNNNMQTKQLPTTKWRRERRARLSGPPTTSCVSSWHTSHIHNLPDQQDRLNNQAELERNHSELVRENNHEYIRDHPELLREREHPELLREREHLREHPELLREREHPELLREREHTELLREREHTEILRERENTEQLQEREHTELLREREHPEILREREHPEILRERDHLRNIEGASDTEHLRDHPQYIRDRPENRKDNRELIREPRHLADLDQMRDHPELIRDGHLRDRPEYIRDHPELVRNHPEMIVDHQELVRESPDIIREHMQIRENPDLIREHREIIRSPHEPLAFQHRAFSLGPLSTSLEAETPLDMTVPRVNRGSPPSYSQAVASSALHRPSVIIHSATRSLSMCDPIIEEHFRRSLGNDYQQYLCNPVSSSVVQQTVAHHPQHAHRTTSLQRSKSISSYPMSKVKYSSELPRRMAQPSAQTPPHYLPDAEDEHRPLLLRDSALSVDDHFAKALGDTWRKIKEGQSTSPHQ